MRHQNRGRALLNLVLSASLLFPVACGVKSTGSETDSGAGLGETIEGGIRLAENPRALKASSLPAGGSLVSFDEKGHLRMRDGQGRSYLLSRDFAPAVEWLLTDVEKAQLAAPSPLYRATADLAWRFEDKRVITYTKSAAGWLAKGNVKVWPTGERAWRPLGIEGLSLIAYAEGKVREVTFDPRKFAAREFTWPADTPPPVGAGYLSENVIWVFGGSSFYLVNMATGVWKVGAFGDVPASWGDLRSMAIRVSSEARVKYSLDKPVSFAILGSKGLFAMGFQEGFVQSF